jgi:hypothetical protein
MLNLQSTVTCRPHGRSDHHHSPATPNTHHTRSHHHFFSPPLPLSSRPHLFPPFLFTFTILLQARLLSPGGRASRTSMKRASELLPGAPATARVHPGESSKAAVARSPAAAPMSSLGGRRRRPAPDGLPGSGGVLSRGGGGELPGRRSRNDLLGAA